MDFTALNQKQVAAAMGTNPRTIRRWVADGCPKNDDGTYSLPDVVGWRIDLEAEAAAPSTEDGARYLAEWRKERAQIARMDREERETVLIRREDAEKDWIDHIMQARSRLLSIPNRLGPVLSDHFGGDRLQTANAVEDAREVIHETLKELANSQFAGDEAKTQIDKEIEK